MREGRNLLRPLPVGGGRDESRPSRSKASYRQEFATAKHNSTILQRLRPKIGIRVIGPVD